MSSTAFVNGSTLSDAGWANDTDTLVYSGLSSVSGTNTIVGTGPASMTAYAAKQRFLFIPANTNTAATTINITPSGGSALGAKNIFWNGAACVGGEIRQNVPCEVIYDGTQFNLISQPTAKVLGTTTNDSAAAGYIGEFITTGNVAAAAISASDTFQDIGTISLTAGDWDISLLVDFQINGATGTACRAGIGTASGSSSAGLSDGDNAGWSPFPTAATDGTVSIPAYRVSIASTTSYYAKMLATFSAGNPKGGGRMSARRVR